LLMIVYEINPIMNCLDELDLTGGPSLEFMLVMEASYPGKL